LSYRKKLIEVALLSDGVNARYTPAFCPVSMEAVDCEEHV